MDSFSFYKGIYDRELNRRKDLDSAINTPVTILTVLFTANFYLLNKIPKPKTINDLTIEEVIFVIIFIIVAVSIFYLTKSYNNLFRGFVYRNIAKASQIREFESSTIPKYNLECEKGKELNFENELINKLTKIAENHTVMNNTRSLDLYKTKTFIIIALILTAINSLILTFKYFQNV
jgi:hypothetical protein